MKFYKKQYPRFGSSSLSFIKPDYRGLKHSPNVFLPTVMCLRRGRPRKGRFVGEREKKIRAYMKKKKKNEKKKASKRTL